MALKLTTEDIAMFENFRVPLDLVERNGVHRITDCEAREALGINGTWKTSDLSGILFPYFYEDRRVGARLRRDNPEREAGRTKNKYVSEQGRSHLYFLREAAAELADMETMLCFVESEKSAIALTAWAGRMRSEIPDLKLVFVGTGGCWGWRSRLGRTLAPDGKYVDEKGPLPELACAHRRKCFILFDSNSQSNEDVKRARLRFAATLRNEFGAKEVVKLLLPEGDWNGPDDYIERNTDRALVAVFNDPEADTVRVAVGEFPRVTDEAEEILLTHAHGLRIFQRGGELVRIVSLPQALRSHGLDRPPGTVMLEPLSAPALAEILERVAVFEKAGEDGKITRANCPAQVVAYYLARRGEWRVDPLLGIVTSPLVRTDGTILSRPGYDPQSGLYLCGELPVSVPDEPTREDAEAALARLSAPFREFPFCTDADRAVAIAAIVTAIERRVLDACPLFGYSAPAPRTGKSKLAAAAAILATGKPAPASAVSPNPEELRKALFAALREGYPVVNLDNVEHPLKSADLCKILTETEYSDRVLGESTRLHLPTNLTWTATGNNLAFRGDLAQRALVCRIDAAIERPEQRSFQIPDLQGHLLEHRAELVSAALTILRAFHVAGRPEQALPRWGGFDLWSRFVREPLVWAGLADACLTRDDVLDDDPEKELAAEALRQLREAFPARFTVKEAIEKANDVVLGKTWAYPELHDSLVAVSGGGKTVDAEILGKWMRSWRDRYVNGIRLVRVRAQGAGSNKTAVWSVA